MGKQASNFVQGMEKIIRIHWKLIILVLLSVAGGTFFLFKNVPSEDEVIFEPPSKEKGYFELLKIRGYTQGNVPLVDIVIENKTIPAIIDLGFQGMLSLPSHFVKDIAEKKWIQSIRCYGMRGKIHEQDIYEVNNIQIQDILFIRAMVVEKSLEMFHEGILIGTIDPKKEPFGGIGWKLLSNSNLLIDCKYSVLAFCDSLETLKNQGYPTNSLIETPMIFNFDCIGIDVLSDYGPLRCIFDTGCTCNMLNKDLENGCNDHRILTSDNDSLFLLNPENKDLLIFEHEDIQEISSFRIGENEFGPLTFHRMKSPINIDVILGMEFFNTHLVFLDFENEKVYLFPYTGDGEVAIGGGHERKN